MVSLFALPLTAESVEKRKILRTSEPEVSTLFPRNCARFRFVLSASDLYIIMSNYYASMTTTMGELPTRTLHPILPENSQISEMFLNPIPPRKLRNVNRKQDTNYEARLGEIAKESSMSGWNGDGQHSLRRF